MNTVECVRSRRKITMWKEVVEKANVNFERNFGLLLVGEQRLRTEVLLP